MPRDDSPIVFEQLRLILKPYEERLSLKLDSLSEYSLYAPYSEKWKRELPFGAVQVKKNYVSFHLMPVYMFPDLLEGSSDALRKRMQGKSCFNFKRVQHEVFEELAQLTERGFARFAAEKLLGG